MDNALIVKAFQKGQLVIPVVIHKVLGIEKGSKVFFKVKNDEIRIRKIPIALDWSNLVDQLPEEKVEFDEDSHYDPQK